MHWLPGWGRSRDAARNSTLVLMVLFENVQVFNGRPETCSAVRQCLIRNRARLTAGPGCNAGRGAAPSQFI